MTITKSYYQSGRSSHNSILFPKTLKHRNQRRRLENSEFGGESMNSDNLKTIISILLPGIVEEPQPAQE